MKKIYSLLFFFMCALQGILATQQAGYHYNQPRRYSNVYRQHNMYSQPVSSKRKVWKVIAKLCVAVVVLVVIIVMGLMLLPEPKNHYSNQGKPDIKRPENNNDASDDNDSNDDDNNDDEKKELLSDAEETPE